MENTKKNLTGSSYNQDEGRKKVGSSSYESKNEKMNSNKVNSDAYNQSNKRFELKSSKDKDLLSDRSYNIDAINDDLYD